MKRWLFLLVVCVGSTVLLPRDAFAAIFGDGGVHIDRLPWVWPEGRVLTTGWGGCTAFGSHCPGGADEFATDWSTSPSASFWALAATEG